MKWEFYIDQPLDTGDLVWCAKGGYAVVGSGLTTGEPSRIDSIPEAWSAEIKFLESGGIMKDVNGKIFDRINYIQKLEKP